MAQKYSDIGEVLLGSFHLAKKIMSTQDPNKSAGVPLYIPTYNEGFGGIHKVFWANGYEFLNHFSIGVTTSYLFGSINNKSIILGQAASIYLSTNNNTFYDNLYFDYGFQYYGSINAHWDFTIGAVYANQTNLKSGNKYQRY